MSCRLYGTQDSGPFTKGNPHQRVAGQLRGLFPGEYSCLARRSGTGVRASVSCMLLVIKWFDLNYLDSPLDTHISSRQRP